MIYELLQPLALQSRSSYSQHVNKRTSQQGPDLILVPIGRNPSDTTAACEQDEKGHERTSVGAVSPRRTLPLPRWALSIFLSWAAALPVRDNR